MSSGVEYKFSRVQSCRLKVLTISAVPTIAGSAKSAAATAMSQVLTPNPRGAGLPLPAHGKHMDYHRTPHVLRSKPRFMAPGYSAHEPIGGTDLSGALVLVKGGQLRSSVGGL